MQSSLPQGFRFWPPAVIVLRHCQWKDPSLSLTSLPKPWLRAKEKAKAAVVRLYILLQNWLSMGKQRFIISFFSWLRHLGLVLVAWQVVGDNLTMISSWQWCQWMMLVCLMMPAWSVRSGERGGRNPGLFPEVQKSVPWLWVVLLVLLNYYCWPNHCQSLSIIVNLGQVFKHRNAVRTMAHMLNQSAGLVLVNCASGFHRAPSMALLLWSFLTVT